MIGQLPRVLSVGGKNYEIDADFRNILTINEALNDEKLNARGKAYICLKRLYKDYEAIPLRFRNEALERALWFISGGDIPKSKPTQKPVLDWKHDEGMIFSAVNHAAGCEVRELDFMHWWTFLGWLSERSENCRLSVVINIRYKLSEGKKLEKWEKEFLRDNKDTVILYTEAEKEAISKTEEFLKTIT